MDDDSGRARLDVPRGHRNDALRPAGDPLPCLQIAGFRSARPIERARTRDLDRVGEFGRRDVVIAEVAREQSVGAHEIQNTESELGRNAIFRKMNPVAVILQRMSRPSDAVTTSYVAKYLRDWGAASKDNKMSALAKRFDLPPSSLNQIASGSLGIGAKSGDRYARLCGFKNYAELMNAATQWASSSEAEKRKTLVGKKHIVALNERYPNRAIAMRAARDLGLSEKAIADIAEAKLESNTDKPSKWWFEKIQDRDKVYSDPFAKAGPSGKKDEDQY